MRPRLVIVAALTFGFTQLSWSEPAKPPPPPQTVPDLQGSQVTVLCVVCDRPFGSDGHKEAMKTLASNVYAAELRRALFYQDTLHQFESRAHFDNCDFDSATAYVDELLEEAGGHVKAATSFKANSDNAGIEVSAKKAFFAIGQALHVVQDFYAHSNYIELTKDTVKNATDIAVVPTWTPEGKAQLQKLRQNGLVSGYVFWGVPQRCPTGAMSHGDLAKDSDTTKSGRVKVAHLENLSQYRLAVVTARQASSQFLRHAFKRWPLLNELNGKYLAFEVLVDRRGL